MVWQLAPMEVTTRVAEALTEGLTSPLRSFPVDRIFARLIILFDATTPKCGVQSWRMWASGGESAPNFVSLRRLA
jgi:hypothetical protein